MGGAAAVHGGRSGASSVGKTEEDAEEENECFPCNLPRSYSKDQRDFFNQEFF